MKNINIVGRDVTVWDQRVKHIEYPYRDPYKPIKSKDQNNIQTMVGFDQEFSCAVITSTKIDNENEIKGESVDTDATHSISTGFHSIATLEGYTFGFIDASPNTFHQDFAEIAKNVSEEGIKLLQQQPTHDEVINNLIGTYNSFAESLPLGFNDNAIIGRTFKTDNGNYRLVGFSRGMEETRLITYNPKTKKITHIPFNPISNFCRFDQVIEADSVIIPLSHNIKLDNSVIQKLLTSLPKTATALDCAEKIMKKVLEDAEVERKKQVKKVTKKKSKKQPLDMVEDHLKFGSDLLVPAIKVSNDQNYYLELFKKAIEHQKLRTAHPSYMEDDYNNHNNQESLNTAEILKQYTENNIEKFVDYFGVRETLDMLEVIHPTTIIEGNMSRSADGMFAANKIWDYVLNVVKSEDPDKLRNIAQKIDFNYFNLITQYSNQDKDISTETLNIAQNIFYQELAATLVDEFGLKYANNKIASLFENEEIDEQTKELLSRMINLYVVQVIQSEDELKLKNIAKNMDIPLLNKTLIEGQTLQLTDKKAIKLTQEQLRKAQTVFYETMYIEQTVARENRTKKALGFGLGFSWTFFVPIAVIAWWHSRKNAEPIQMRVETVKEKPITSNVANMMAKKKTSKPDIKIPLTSDYELLEIPENPRASSAPKPQHEDLLLHNGHLRRVRIDGKLDVSPAGEVRLSEHGKKITVFMQQGKQTEHYDSKQSCFSFGKHS